MTDTPVRTEQRDGALLIIIDNPPVNVAGQAVRAGLLVAVATAEQLVATGAIDRVVVTGAGRAFVAGADAREFDGPALEPHLPDVLLRLQRLPSVAAINGAALGAGLELALGCRVRVVGPKALLGLPEVTLGIVPGGGGSQRLPRLIGIDRALPLVATGRRIGAAKAVALGIADLEADDPVAAALALGPDALARAPIDDLPVPAAAPDAVAAALKHAETAQRGEAAPLRAIDLVAATSHRPIAEGLATERATFLELRTGAQARALRHVFFAERAAASPADLKGVEPGPVESALVAGDAPEVAGISAILAAGGVQVTAFAPPGVATADDAGACAPVTVQEDPDAPPPHVDIAIAVGREAFGRLAAALPETTPLALAGEAAARHGDVPVTRPDRIVGLDFLAPSGQCGLIEVIPASQTGKKALATAHALARRLGCVAVRGHGIAARLRARMLAESETLRSDGATAREVEEALVAFGMAAGSRLAGDLQGLDRGGDGQVGRQTYPSGEIAGRIVTALAAEGAALVEAGIARRSADVDLVMIHGFGFPRWRGGPMKMAVEGGATGLRAPESSAR